jgi:hypothetical protein
MEVEMDHAPTAAERLRSLLRTASSLDVVASGRRMQLMDSHTIDADGRMLLAVPDDCALALDLVDGQLPARIELTDVAPVAMRNRVRARAVLDGRLSVIGPHPRGRDVPAILAALDLVSAELTESGTVVAVDPEQFAAAAPDLLASRESALLCHLVDTHADMVAWLSRLVPAERLHGVRRVHPLRLDRYGVVLRLEFPSTDRDARLPFTEPLGTVEEAPSRMLELLARARMCRRRTAL